MKNRTILATGLVVLAAGAATTGAVAASPKPKPVPAVAEKPASTPAPAPRRADPPARKRRTKPKPAPRRSKAAASPRVAAMDPDRNPDYTRDLRAWVACMNEQGLRTEVTLTGVTAGGWTWGEPTNARERHLLSEAGWDEARAIEVSCQAQAFG